MGVKAGSIITVGHGTTLVERLQSSSPALDIPKTKVYELGNYETVGTVYDTPELTFTLESFDVSTETEALLCDVDPATDGINLDTAVPLNVIQNFKPGKKRPLPLRATNGVAIPYLTIESASYKFGYKDSATETFTLKGDSIYYCPGCVYIDEAAGTGVAGQVVVTSHAAYPYTDVNGERRVLAVVVGPSLLTEGPDYTLVDGAVVDDAAIVTVTLTEAVAVTDTVRVIYNSPDPIDYAQSVHTPATLRPAAVRGKDIDVYIGGYDPDDVAGSAANKVTGIQNVTVDWRVTQEIENELGNPKAVSRDFDVPTVSGTIDFLPRDVDDLFSKIRLITGTTSTTDTMGPDIAVPLELDVVIKDAESSGATLKRLHVDDARFSVPGYNPRVEQTITVTFEWESDSGELIVYRDLGLPAVTAVTPDEGEAADEVIITGVNFVGVTDVDFDATPATSFTVDNHRQITATVPAGAGTVDITVTTGEGTSAITTADEFTYVVGS